MLPEKKSDFPKCLYLDQNFWIGIAQAASGISAGDRFKGALLAVRTGVDTGRLVLPLSFVHLIEAAIPGDEGRRERLIKFMLELSRGKAVQHYAATRRVEIGNAVRDWFQVGGAQPVRPMLLKDSPFSAMGAELDFRGVPPEHRDLLRTLIERPSTFLAAFADMSANRDSVRDAVASETRGVEELEKYRAQVQATATPTQHELLLYSTLFRDGFIRDELEDALKAVGVSVADWCRDVLRPDALPRFGQSIPFVHVYVALELAHRRNTSRKYDKNDPRDLVWLSTALPYSNVVAGETYWTTLATPLGIHYGTRLTNNPAHLAAALAEEGCC